VKSVGYGNIKARDSSNPSLRQTVEIKTLNVHLEPVLSSLSSVSPSLISKELSRRKNFRLGF
jgi:hypothetical protein